MKVNFYSIKAIYTFEMARTWRTLMQSIASPVISTSLYFVVFGSAIGSRMVEIDGVSYGAFIIPGLIMLSLMTQSISNASFGIYMPTFSGTIYEVLSAPLSAVEIVIGFVGAAATKSIILGLVILATGAFFVDLTIQHPFMMFAYLVLISLTFSLFGFIIGIWSQNFEQLQFFPMLIITPLTFLGGAFYSIDMLPGFWQGVSMINPILYMVNAFRYGILGVSDVNPYVALGMILLFIAILSAISLRMLARGKGIRH